MWHGRPRSLERNRQIPRISSQDYGRRWPN
jgi:hypothetical protein